MTPRHADALAAWWHAGGSNVRAAFLLGKSEQTIRNQLCEARAREHVRSNLELALRHLEEIKARPISPSHNAAKGEG